MTDKSITCVLFDGKFVVAEYTMSHWIPVIKTPKPLDPTWYSPNTYYMDTDRIESLSYEYVGVLPDGRCLYALDK